ncbi:MAG: DNA recombination protein RmuC [Planctomycetes bacterium]|nr:DNA recombination protein RmuC [Planctomycetota bacterium]
MNNAIVVWFIAGAISGFFCAWLYFVRSKPEAAPADMRLEDELRTQISALSGKLIEANERLRDTETALATANAQKAAAENLLSQQKTRHEQDLGRIEAAHNKALLDLREAFRALSAEALNNAAPEFLRLAEQSFGKLQESAKGDLAQRQEAIRGLVEPLRQQLDAYQNNLQNSGAAQSSALGEVKQHLEELAKSNQSLAKETQQFRLVLNSSQARGNWGEETLRRVVEAAGMSVHCDFIEQAANDESRPDLVIKLPEDRVIIVDSKVPDLGFIKGLESADPEERSQELEAHANKLSATIKALAAREYPKLYKNALDYVVLFVPAESLFSAALEGDPDLIVWAAERRVLLATPSSLIAMLRSVALSWQHYAQKENAQRIAEVAQTLYKRLVTFTEHCEKIGDGLKKANGAFNDAVGSYTRMIKPLGLRLEELNGLERSKAFDELQPLDSNLRTLGVAQ